MARIAVLAVALTLFVGPLSEFASAKDGTPSAEAPAKSELHVLMERFASPESRVREKAAEAIARDHYAPDELVPWLTKQLNQEKDFHVRLTLAWALAEQGERTGLKILIDSLKVTGHLGYNHLSQVSGKNLGGPGLGWNRPAWVKWYDTLDAAAWREAQRKKHALRYPVDADEEGLKRAIAWWKTTELQDVDRLPVVKVTLRSRYAGNDGPGKELFGFVVKGSPTQHTVFTTDMHTTAYTKKSGASSSYPRVEALDAERDLVRVLDSLTDMRSKPPGSRKALRDPFIDRSDWSQSRHPGFLMAMALYQNGKKSLALRIWQYVGKIDTRWSEQTGTWSVVEQLQRNIASRVHTHWESALLSTHKTWRQSLDTLSDLQRRFKTNYEDDIATLRKMADEESHYTLPKTKDVTHGKLDPRLLVRALPNVQTWAMGRLRIRRLVRTPDSTAGRDLSLIERILQADFDAVPALVEAVDDVRFTRSGVESVRGKAWMPYSFHIARVGELATALIECIAGREFEFGDQGTKEEAIKRWWAEVKTKGEATVLVNGIAERGPACVAQASRLARRYPKQAIQPILAAIRSASDATLAAALIRTLEPVPSPEATTLLRAYARKGNSTTRLAAASVLQAQGDRFGLESILSDWYALAPETNALEAALGARTFAYPVGMVDVLKFLCAADPVVSLKRMRATIDKASPATRACIAENIGIERATEEDLFGPRIRVPKHASNSLEELLVSMLQDDRVHKTHMGPSSTRHLNQLQIGDLAARSLGALWPKRYPFPKAPSRTAALHHRYAFLNTWRKDHGLPPVDMPATPKLKSVSPERFRAALADWRNASDKKARAKAKEALLGLGLGALPLLKDVRTKSPSETKQLSQILRELSCTVREVNWGTSTLAPSDELRRLTEQLRGEVLRGKNILLILNHFATNRPEEATGIQMNTARRDDGTGVVLDLRLVKQRTSSIAGNGRWELSRGSGNEYVDDDLLRDPSSWWHETRGPQLDEKMHVPIDLEWRIEQTLLVGRER